MASAAEISLRLQLTREITGALSLLLGSRHLYQSVDIASDFLQQYVERAATSARSDAERQVAGIQLTGISRADWIAEKAHSAASTAQSLAARIASVRWQPHRADVTLNKENPGTLLIELPTIQTLCPHCDGVWPFNAGTNSRWGSLEPTEHTLVGPILTDPLPTLTGGGRPKAYLPASKAEELMAKLVTAIVELKQKTHQLLLLPYQCQQCKDAPVTFLVRRAGLKMTLCGREPIETIQVPPVIPKAQRKYFGDAIIAHHASHTLAGLFLLRTFIEQFWLSLNLTSEPIDQRLTGENFGEAYAKTLPSDFKSRFPSLGDLYGQLSVAMHSADANAALFESTVTALTEHFEARRLFRLDLPPPPA